MPPTSRPATALVDLDHLERLRELGDRYDTNLLDELVAMFLRDTPPRLAELRTACQLAHRGRVELAAHTLKSSCLQLGVRGVAVPAGQLETVARHAPAAKLRGLSRMVECAYWQVVEVLTVESARHPRRT